MSNEDLHLSLIVKTASGETKRWGPDEVDGRDIPSDLRLGSSLPGGHKTLECSLIREFNRTNPDANVLDELVCSGPGAREGTDGRKSAFEGYLTEIPKQQGDSFTIEPGATGYSGCLSDFEAFARPYIDRDLSNWSGPGLTRKQAVNGTYKVGDPSAAYDSAAPGLQMQITDAWASPKQPLVEAWYDAGPGRNVAQIWLDLAGSSDAGSDATFDCLVYTADTDSSGFSSASADLWPPGAAAWLATTAKRYALIRWLNNATPGGAAGKDYSLFLRALAVVTDHGLTLRGTGATAGFFNSDLVADIVSETAPLLNYTLGPDGSIEQNAVIVPHFVAGPEAMTGAEAIGRASAFGFDALTLPEWGVYDDKTFFWRKPKPDRLCWEARLWAGAKPRFEGEQSDDVINGIVIYFTDASGKQRSVGPPAAYWRGGVALCDQTDDSLIDTSPDNIANAHGRERKWPKIVLSRPADYEIATTMAAVQLAIRSQPQRRGQIELTGTVGHPTIAMPQAVWKVRAGDYIRLTDSAEPWVKRRIISADYTHAARACTVTVDNTPFTLDAMLELMGADQIGWVG